MGKITEQDVLLAERLRTYASELSILFVEDDEKLRESAYDLLKIASFKDIGVASNGQEALEAYAKRRYDLILTDINMPVKNGIELIKTIREYGCEVPIIVFSAHNESQYYNELINLGIDGFILKPLNMLLFMFTLSRACKALYDAKANETLKQELISEQNRIIAYSYAIENHLDIPPKEMAILRKSYNVISAADFIDGYPTDITNFADRLASLDEDLDIYIDRFLNGKDEHSKEQVAITFEKYGTALDAIPEFANLSVGLKNFSKVIFETQAFENVDTCKDMLFGVVTELRSWRLSVFERKDAANIHYLDASLINDLITMESILRNTVIEGENVEFF